MGGIGLSRLLSLPESMQLLPGGTANLAVLGGNLPQSFGTADARTDW
jgi:hypothetical protein